MTTFLSATDEITPAWLTDALRAADALDGDVTVDGLHSERIGTGQIGACHRLSPTYSSDVPGLPERLVLKVPSDDEGSRAFAAAIDAYAREVAFYRDVAPQLTTRTPACFAAEVSDDRRNFVLLVEDLGPATECDQLSGCEPEQAALAMEQAAALHASSWNDERLRGLDWLRSGLGVWDHFAAGAAEQGAAFAERYGDALEPEYLDIAGKLGAGLTRAWVAGLHQPRCLWHGDFRLDNLLFDAKGGEVPLAVVDWQSVTLSQGPVDVAYFLGAGLPTPVRREHEERLVRLYHDALVDGGVKDYAWDDCWTEYRANGVSGFVIGIAASVSVEQTTRGDEMFLTMARRHGAQLVDLQGLDVIAAR